MSSLPVSHSTTSSIGDGTKFNPPVLPGAAVEVDTPQTVCKGRCRSLSTASTGASESSTGKVGPTIEEVLEIKELQRGVEDLEKTRITKGLMKFDNDRIEAEYVKTVIDPMLRTRIVPVVVVLFIYSIYSFGFSDCFIPTPCITQWHTPANTLFNLSWIYHALSSIAMFILCIAPIRAIRAIHIEVIAQSWLNLGIWIGVIFSNRWRCAKVFGYDPAIPFGEGLDDQTLPYTSDAGLLLVLNSVVIYFCVWTPSRVRLSISLAVTVCLSYISTSIILGLPNTDDPFSQSIMLIVLVAMVTAGGVTLERSRRSQFIATNVSVRKTKILQQAIRTLKEGDDADHTNGYGPITNFEKAVTDVGFALNILEMMSGCVQQSEGIATVAGDERESSEDRISTELYPHTDDNRDRILEATTLIKESVRTLSRAAAARDRLVLHNDSSLSSDESGRDFINYINQVINGMYMPQQYHYHLHYHNHHHQLMKSLTTSQLSPDTTRLEHITPRAFDMLQEAGHDFNLNVLELQEVHLCHIPVLPLIASRVTLVMPLESMRINKGTLNKFLNRISALYTDVEYHNQSHAAQVTSHGEYLFRATGIPVSALDHTAYLVACICHDVGHSGKNNAFYIETRDCLALRYNDKSVLEQFHAATTFEMMEDFPECNILEDLTSEGSKRFRFLVIELILATDMAKHFAIMADLRIVLQSPQFRTAINESKNDDDRQLIFKACIKAADIGHTCLPWDQHYELSLRLAEEFFKQGDLEKQLHVAVSPLCDREKVDLPVSQLGFIDYLVRPFIEILMRVDAYQLTDKIKEQLERNAHAWKKQKKIGRKGLPVGWSYTSFNDLRTRSTTASPSKMMNTPVKGDAEVPASSPSSPQRYSTLLLTK